MRCPATWQQVLGTSASCFDLEVFFEFVADAKKKGEVKVAVLIPCDAGAPWFRRKALSQWKRRQVWPAGSDLFRLAQVDDDLEPGGWRWRKLPRTAVSYAVLTTW